MSTPTHQRPSRRWLWIITLCLSLSAACALAFWAFSTSGQRSVPTRPPVYLPSGKKTSGTPIFNLAITEEGGYQLSRDDLLAAGLSLSAADAARLTITWRGQPVPISLSRDGDDFSLYFYGQPSSSRYSAENIYQLEWGTPFSMTTRSPAATELAAASELAEASKLAAANVYTNTTHNEQNLVYAPLAKQVEGWFWQAITAPSSNNFEIELLQASAGPAQLRLGLWSNTQAEISPDHHLQAKINGLPVLDATWDGEGFQILQAEIPPQVLASGTNQVEITLPGDTGVAAERSYLDWVEVIYPRQAAVEDDFAKVEGTDRPIKLSGFSGPITLWQIASITETLQIRVGEADRGTASIPAGEGKDYLAIGPNGFRTPGMRPMILAPDLRTMPAANYIAIGPEDLLTAAQPLLDWHQQEGLLTAAIPLQAIYDQFNAGFAEPEALQRFLAFAVKNWGQAPEYVLLLGDFTFDPRGYTTAPDANRLPTFFTYTHYGGETASDVPFAQFDEDAQPALAVGRLPARNAGQVQNYVDKTLAYMQQTDLAWRWRLLAIADGQEASFATDAQAFLDSFSNEAFEGALFAPPAGTTDANARIGASFEEGYGLVGYFGHGSVNMWGKDRLFTIEDVATLENGKYLPVVVNMNCLTGLFTHPTSISLAETLLWQPNGGAAAVLAPTSLTLPSDQALLSGALVKAINADPGQALGISFLSAQRQMPQDWSGANEVLLTFLYFGDPALRPWVSDQP